MGLIHIDGIRLRANHGCLAEEALIGGDYIVNVMLDLDYSKAEQSDDLADTADYVAVYEIVKNEMAVRSKLIEHVARRIAVRLRNQFPELQAGTVCVIKLRPPMNGDVDRVSVTVSV